MSWANQITPTWVSHRGSKYTAMLYSDGNNRPQNKTRRILKWSSIILGALLLIFGLTLLWAWIYLPKVAYTPFYPRNTRNPPFSKRNILFEPDIVNITTPDNIKLQGYWFKNRDPSKSAKSPTLFFCAYDDVPKPDHDAIGGWQASMSLNVFVLDYRGHGSSEGSHSMTGIQIDAQAGLDYLLKRPDVDPANIILFGHSFGGAVALHLAATNLDKFKAIMIENTFKNVKTLAAHRYPMLAWATFVITENWDNEEQLKSIATSASKKGQHVPHIMFLSGGKDDLIPPEHMNTLWELTQKVKEANPQVHLERLNMPECHHSCFQMTEYVPAVQKFLKSFTGVYINQRDKWW